MIKLLSNIIFMERLLDLKEIQSISLNILKNVDDFCIKNDITYFLACGTLLGAVKYKGFIPWDDDIDIMMPRPEYDKFIDSFSGERYKLIKPQEGRNYYAKVYDSCTIKYEDGEDYKKNTPLGISIDIFPLDGIIDNRKIVEKLRKRSAFLELLLRLSNQPIFYRKNPIKCINRIIPRIIGSRNIVKMIEKNAQTYKYEDCDFVIRMRNTPNGFTGALKKQVYLPPIKLKFENSFFLAPNNYDIWLRTFYGNDYLNELPPITKRTSHHKSKCFLIVNEHA